MSILQPTEIFVPKYLKLQEIYQAHERAHWVPEEADMRQHKLSHVSPLGAALMGKKKGDVFTFETPNGKQTYTIEKVS